MATDNPSCGYDRLEGALKNLGHNIAPTTIRNILRRRGLEPAPLRKPKIAWKTFLKRHWSSLAAADFFTTEVWTSRGLVTFYTLCTIRWECDSNRACFLAERCVSGIVSVA